jgi:methyl-accepting chemotaxis protein
MSKFNNIKIGKRLILVFGILLALMTILGISGYTLINSISDKTIYALNTDAKLCEYSQRGRANTVGTRRYEKDIFINAMNTEAER